MGGNNAIQLVGFASFGAEFVVFDCAPRVAVPITAVPRHAVLAQARPQPRAGPRPGQVGQASRATDEGTPPQAVSESIPCSGFGARLGAMGKALPGGLEPSPSRAFPRLSNPDRRPRQCRYARGLDGSCTLRRPIPEDVLEFQPRAVKRTRASASNTSDGLRPGTPL